MKDYQQKYNEYLGMVEKRIDEYVKAEEPLSLYEPFKYIMTGGGKRIRPVLTMICCGAVGAEAADALDCGTAVEILHNFTLVHDDIMDDSPMRRGKTTIHEKWNMETGILTGDVMVGRAYRLLPSPDKHERSGSINAAFTNGLVEVCEGQAYDTDFDNKDDVSLDDYFLMIDKKTAKMLETAAVIGANAGKGSPEEIEALRSYANYTGIAFQIQDDLLDLTAEQAKLGKTIGLDIVEGKKTYLILKAKEAATSKEDIELLNKFYEQHGLDKEYIPVMREMLGRLGILEQAQKDIDLYFDKALDSLKIIKDNESKEMLVWLVNKLNKRYY